MRTKRRRKSSWDENKNKRVRFNRETWSTNWKSMQELKIEWTDPKLKTDKSCGIEEFLTPGFGFDATVKARFQDFIVREINSKGEVVKVDKVDPDNIPDPAARDKSPKKEDVQKLMPQLEPLVDPLVFKAFLSYHSRKENTEQFIFNFCDLKKEAKVETKDGKGSLVEVREDGCVVKFEEGEPKTLPFAEVWYPKEDVQKAERSSIHKALNEECLKLKHTTNDKNQIVCTWGKKESRWPRETPKHTLFHMAKRNLGTTQAINLLGNTMRSYGRNFGFCGNKDKRGETTQQVTVFRRTPKEILGASKRMRNLKVGNFRFVDEQLKLGAHCGNEFLIVLRNVVHTSPESTEKNIEADVKEACENLKANGFINYYGMQRFGNSAVGTHEVGKMVVKQEWDKVCAAILLPQPFEEACVKDARLEAFNEANVNKLPRWCRIERSVMHSLGSEQPNDWLGALMRLDRSTRNLYVHAFQAYMWNTVVSRRFRKYGVQVLPGDLVHTADGEENFDVRIITEKEVESVDITQVLMPVVGSMTRFPENETKDLYTEFFKEVKMDPSIFTGLEKQWNVKGSYRSFVLRPKKFGYTIKRYNAPEDCLLEDRPFFDDDNEKDCAEPTGKHLAVVLKFRLPNGAFATMLIRELTKTSSTSNFFKSKNHAKSGHSPSKKMESKAEEPTTETALKADKLDDAPEGGNKSGDGQLAKDSGEASKSEPMKVDKSEVPQPELVEVETKETPEPMNVDTKETEKSEVDVLKN